MNRSDSAYYEGNGPLAIDLELCCIALQQPISTGDGQHDIVDMLIRAKHPIDARDDHHQTMCADLHGKQVCYFPLAVQNHIPSASPSGTDLP